MDAGIKQILEELLQLNKETLLQDNADESGAAVLKLVAMQVADTLNDIKRIAESLEKIAAFTLHAERVGEIAQIFMGTKEGIERIANALEPQPEPADLELEELNARGNRVSVAVLKLGGNYMFDARYVRVDDKIVLTPKAHPEYEFERIGESWHGTRRLDDGA